MSESALYKCPQTGEACPNIEVVMNSLELFRSYEVSKKMTLFTKIIFKEVQAILNVAEEDCKESCVVARNFLRFALSRPVVPDKN
jgi:hypothetical protein